MRLNDASPRNNNAVVRGDFVAAPRIAPARRARIYFPAPPRLFDDAPQQSICDRSFRPRTVSLRLGGGVGGETSRCGEIGRPLKKSCKYASDRHLIASRPGRKGRAEKISGTALMPFQNRAEAGRRLAARLTSYRREPAVILALPRGGVPVAAPIAAALAAPLDLVLVRKIGVPFQPELAMGAVADGGAPLTVRNEDVIAMAGVSEAEFDAVRRTELAEIERRRRLYFGDRRRPEVEGRVAIVVDDGVATGATTRAALRAVRARKPRKLVLAVPVAPSDTLDDLRLEVDELVCLEAHRQFAGIGLFYADFRQISDEEVIASLAQFGGSAASDA
jgi:putative phosphoribosyl transferase